MDAILGVIIIYALVTCLMPLIHNPFRVKRSKRWDR